MNRRGRADLTDVFDPVDVANYEMGRNFSNAQGEGVPALAEVIGMKAGVLQNKLDPNNERDWPSIKQWQRGMLASKDVAPLHAVCHKFGGIFVPMPKAEATGDVGILESYAHMHAADGKVSEAVLAALADGRISKAEVRNVTKQVTKQIAKMQAFVAQLDAVSEPDGKGAGDAQR